jgi:hypothetical protein
VVGFSLTIIGMIASVAYWLGRRFASIVRKFDSLRNEFREKLGEVRMEFDSKLGGLKAELGGVEAGLKAGLDSVKAELGGRLDSLQREVQELRGAFARAFEGLKSAVSSSHALTLDFLALKGLLDEKEVGFAKAEVERAASMVKLNPITREELEFLKRVVAKDVNEITLEEAEKIVEIGKRWWFEDGSEIAYKVYLGGLVIRGYIIQGREGGQEALARAPLQAARRGNRALASSPRPRRGFRALRGAGEAREGPRGDAAEEREGELARRSAQEARAEGGGDRRQAAHRRDLPRVLRPGAGDRLQPAERGLEEHEGLGPARAEEADGGGGLRGARQSG